jgi:putative phosphoserine phosphatase/1-acylglycerol-3-phosphate O-acyltransferase
VRAVGNGAAFFDLDRTLLKGASGPLITKALQEAGFGPQRSIPGTGAIYTLFDLVGETLPAMALARGAALIAKGWSAEAVRAAGKAAAEELDTLVTPYARPLIADHKAAGRPVVLATTTPEHLVRPLAERLGFDDVVATRYAEDDGAFTGALEGEFVWAAGKRSAVKRWAKAHDIDMKESYAYSDSIYDLPLLTSVGHPYAVNPDPRLLLAATIARWPVLHLDVPPGVPKILGVEPMEAMRRLANPAALPFARFAFAGERSIPRTGPALVVANHRSYFDPLVLGLLLAKAGRTVRFLGKKEVFDAPIIGTLARSMGQIRVDRGTGSDRPLKEAARALDAGEVVCILPQGTIPRGRAFFDPVLIGRPGAARLAAMTGAPVVPVGLWGTEQVWPRSSKVPHVWNLTDPPRVEATVGQPFSIEAGGDERESTATIMDAITALIPKAESFSQPTEHQISLATP